MAVGELKQERRILDTAAVEPNSLGRTSVASFKYVASSARFVRLNLRQQFGLLASKNPTEPLVFSISIYTLHRHIKRVKYSVVYVLEMEGGGILVAAYRCAPHPDPTGPLYI